MIQDDKKGLLSLHLAVILFGIVGIFAKVVNQPSAIIVLGRVFFSSIFLFCYLYFRKQKIRLNQKWDYFWMIAAGVVLAMHWTFHMQAIQCSTVALGTIAFSTFPLFVIFLEPYFFHEKLKAADVICAIVMLIGVFIMIPEFEFSNSMTQGVIYGLGSALTYAVLGLLNRRFTETYQAAVVSFYEQGVACIVLLPTLFLLRPTITVKDVAMLCVRGVVFTALAHSLFINSLRTVKVRTAGIVSGLESVYSIVAALFFLGEVPSIKEILGGIIILGAVFYSTLRDSK